jgi:hypothetical protein
MEREDQMNNAKLPKEVPVRMKTYKIDAHVDELIDEAKFREGR